MNREFLKSTSVAPRADLYTHQSGNEFTDPDLVKQALRIHAEGYVTMGFVKEEAVAQEGILDDAIDHSRGCFTEYFVATNPNNSKDMATMRKISIPTTGSIEDLPAFELTKEALYSDSVTQLKELAHRGYDIKEIAGLSRTKEASSFAVYELLRSVIQDALYKDEVWFFSIVTTTFFSLRKYFGKSAFHVMGDDVKINDHRVNDRIKLKPVILIPSTAFLEMIQEIESMPDNASRKKIIGVFNYFTEGLEPESLDSKVADFINRNRQIQ